MPLALFAVEAVTNAYAHAFPAGRSGTVSLHFSVEGNGDALLCVGDDGVGFDSSGDTKSMGRQLMNAFAHQLGGTLRYRKQRRDWHRGEAGIPDRRSGPPARYLIGRYRATPCARRPAGFG